MVHVAFWVSKKENWCVCHHLLLVLFSRNNQIGTHQRDLSTKAANRVIKPSRSLHSRRRY